MSTSTIYMQLKLDHRHMSWLTKYYQEELGRFIEGGEQRAECLNNMREIVVYFKTFPELWHHYLPQL